MDSQLAPRPDNVPEDRVFDYDIYNINQGDPEYQALIKKVLNAPEVPEFFWTPRNGGHWVATRAELIQGVLKDWGHFSSNSMTVPKPPPSVPKLVPLQIDPPNHSKYRDLLAPFLSPKSVGVLGESARKLSIELIEGLKPRGECEFIHDFATHLPVAIFMQIAGIPEEDRIKLRDWGEMVMRGDTPEELATGREKLAAYGMAAVRARRGGSGTDLISTVANARIDGELMDDFTLTGMITLLLMAGLDTVASALGFTTRFLALNPDYRRQLVEDPSLIPGAVEEMLRRFPVALLGREVVEDCEYAGVQLKAGDMVILPSQLDGLDDRKFADPLHVDFRRDGNSMNATFGGGAHRCMGSMLARVEMRIFLEEWLKRIPDFEVKPGFDVQVKARSVATVVKLPLVWKI